MKETNVSKKEQTLQKWSNWDSILAFLYKYPYDEFSLQEIASACSISKSTAFRTISELQTRGAVVLTTIANLWRIKLNIENPQVVRERIIANFAAVYRSGIVEYIISKWGPPRAIILFGSVRKGEDTRNSDIDIAVEISEKKDVETVSLDKFNDEGARALKEFEKLMDRKFQLLFFNRENVDLNVFNNIANGIVLSGFLEVKP